MEKTFYEEIKEITGMYCGDEIKGIINSAKKQVKEAARKGLHCYTFAYYYADKRKAEYIKDFFKREGFTLIMIEENDQFIGITISW